MNQKITGFHQDEEQHWVADLECGHAQHVRHDPPWMEREWVITPEGRATRLGTALNCVRCDELGLKVAKSVLLECKKVLVYSYESAGISGLCDEGRWEAALGSLDTISLRAVAESALRDLHVRAFRHSAIAILGQEHIRAGRILRAGRGVTSAQAFPAEPRCAVADLSQNITLSPK